MADLLARSGTPSAEDKCVVRVTPESAGWQHVGFAVHKLKAGEGFSGQEEGREVCLVILSGTADVTAGDMNLPRIGERTSVFDPIAPAAVYVPANTRYHIEARTKLEVAVCSAPATGAAPNTAKPRYIAPDTLSVEIRGDGTKTRHVRNILPETEPAESLLVVEVITPGGNWSSYPPHKHDSDSIPEETALEETYYHRLSPSQGFAFQRVYTDDRSLDETMSVEDGDVVMVPRGYHPVGAPHGYTLYYLNVMAGPKRQWIFRNDPDHDWIMQR